MNPADMQSRKALFAFRCPHSNDYFHRLNCGENEQSRSAPVDQPLRPRMGNEPNNTQQNESRSDEEKNVEWVGQQMRNPVLEWVMARMRKNMKRQHGTEEEQVNSVHTVRCSRTTSSLSFEIGPSTTIEPRSMM